MVLTNNYLNLYKNIITEQQTEAEVDFLIKNLRISENDKILDLACGLGRHSNELAKRGYYVTGIDIDPILIQEAMKNSCHYDSKVQYTIMDLRDFSKSNEYNKIYLLYCYFERSQFLTILGNVFKTLKKGGLFCFDVPNKAHFRSTKTPQDYPQDASHRNDIFPEINFKYKDIIHSVVRTYSTKNILLEEHLYEIVSVMYEFDEILTMLNRTGLKVLKKFSDWSYNLFSEDSPRIIVLCEK